jgi:hypothetical protein
VTSFRSGIVQQLFEIDGHYSKGKGKEPQVGEVGRVVELNVDEEGESDEKEDSGEEEECMEESETEEGREASLDKEERH